MLHLLLFMIVFNTSNQVQSTEIIFTNGSNVVAIGTPHLHFRRDVPKMGVYANWYLQTTKSALIVANRWNSTTDSCDIIYTNTALYFSSSCQSRNETHFTSTVTLKPIPPNVLEIQCIFGELSNLKVDAAELHSTYCPNIVTNVKLVAYNSTNAVYNQQIRFSCSKGEVYDGSSINPDYYRTCQFDATWSGEIPECRLVGPTSLSKVMFETVEYRNPLIVYLNFTASPAINKNTTLLTKLSSASNITPVNSTGYKIVKWSSYHQAIEWNIDNFTNEYEGQYIFTAWSTVTPQVMIKSFELKVASSSTMPVTTTTSSCHCECKTDNESSIGLTVGIIVAVVLVIMVVGVAVFVVKRKLHTQSDSNKPNYKEPSIYENQLASSTDIESKYEKIVPSSGQKELYEDPMPTYANTQHIYQNIKPNN